VICVKIEGGSGEAEYLQLARAIRQEIIDGKLPVGEPLPSSRSMKELHGIGRATWGRAVAELKQQGLIAVRKGQGAWVAARPAVQVVEIAAGDRVASRAATEDERTRLGAGLLTPVLVVTRASGATEVYSAAVTICQATCAAGSIQV
jgi:DNA-binding transcriptional regulator YhcF (GntR family)